jgi:glycosyltransferase involved in cell wall biosynthesis
VKIQRLTQVWPNNPWRFDLMYLVSSRLPADVEAAVRHASHHGRPLVWNQNGVAYSAWHGAGWEATNAVMARCLRQAAYVIYQSDFCRACADRFLGVAPVPAEVLYNAVDTAFFAPSPMKAQRPLTLLVGGTQDLEYRLTTALDALVAVRREIPDARMVVTGRMRWTADEVGCSTQAARHVATRGLEAAVSFTGPYTQGQAPSLYHRGDVLVHAKYNDPSPGLVVEAMACGLPVVYSASGGVPEMVGKEAGIGVPAELSWDRELPPDPVDVANAVLEVAARRDHFAEAARERAVRLFDIKPWIERHREIFARVLSSCRA